MISRPRSKAAIDMPDYERSAGFSVRYRGTPGGVAGRRDR